MTSPNRPIVNYPAKVWKSNMTINAKGMRYDSTDNLSFVADQSDKIWPTATEWNWAGTTVAQWELYWKKRSTTIGGFTLSSQLSERNVNVFARFQVLKHQLTAQCCKIWPAMGRGAQDTPPGWAFFGLKTAKMPKSPSPWELMTFCPATNDPPDSTKSHSIFVNAGAAVCINLKVSLLWKQPAS